MKVAISHWQDGTPNIMAAVSLRELHEKVSHADGDDCQLNGKHDGVPSRLEDAAGHLPQVEPVA